MTWRGNLGVKSSSSTIYFILGNYHSPIFFLWVNVEFCFQQVDCSGSKCLFTFAENTLHLGLNLSLRKSSDFLCGCSFSYFTVTHFIWILKYTFEFNISSLLITLDGWKFYSSKYEDQYINCLSQLNFILWYDSNLGLVGISSDITSFLKHLMSMMFSWVL